MGEGVGNQLVITLYFLNNFKESSDGGLSLFLILKIKLVKYI